LAQPITTVSIKGSSALAKSALSYNTDLADPPHPYSTIPPSFFTRDLTSWAGLFFDSVFTLSQNQISSKLLAAFVIRSIQEFFLTFQFFKSQMMGHTSLVSRENIKFLPGQGAVIPEFPGLQVADVFLF
jgi:hypothetical protein